MKPLDDRAGSDIDKSVHRHRHRGHGVGHGTVKKFFRSEKHFGKIMNRIMDRLSDASHDAIEREGEEAEEAHLPEWVARRLDRLELATDRLVRHGLAEKVADRVHTLMDETRVRMEDGVIADEIGQAFLDRLTEILDALGIDEREEGDDSPPELDDNDTDGVVPPDVTKDRMPPEPARTEND